MIEGLHLGRNLLASVEEDFALKGLSRKLTSQQRSLWLVLARLAPVCRCSDEIRPNSMLTRPRFAFLAATRAYPSQSKLFLSTDKADASCQVGHSDADQEGFR